MKTLFLGSAGLCLLLSLSGSYLAHRTNTNVPRWTTAAAPDHAAFDKLLKKYVDSNGLIDYRGFGRSKAELKAYTNMLAENTPSAIWDKNDQLAYWINAYNAFTIQLILDHYPVKSIKDIGSKRNIPFINSPWDIKFIRLGDQTYDLNNIEHGIIRRKFTDPRIHFALMCAAKSCPRVRNEAFEGDRLDAQLEAQGVVFFNNPAKNSITPQQASLSKIMEWYGDDFMRMKGQSVTQVVNRFSKTKITGTTRISYRTYDWSLNEQ